MESISEWFAIFFLLYRCVFGFALLNVVTSVFVQQTMKTANSDEELAFKQKEKDKAAYNLTLGPRRWCRCYVVLWAAISRESTYRTQI